MPPSLPRIPATAAVATLLLVSVGQLRAQVIRSYEGLDRSAGEAGYVTMGVAFNGKTGNTEYSEFDLSGAVGYRGDRHWLRFYPAYRIRRSGGETEEHERSAHLRHSYFFSEATRSFAFVQLQADESLEVERRFLLGGGLRRSLVRGGDGTGIDLGVGIMYENERIETGEEDSVIRGTNLVVVNETAGAVALTLTGFFQPLLDDWGDHRVSAAGSAAVPLGEAWSLEVAVGWRRDSRPPTDIDPDDASLTVGLRFALD